MEYSTDPLNLRPHELNAAIYGTDDLPAEFLDSIREFGVLTPLVVLEDGTIISGHRRWLAAKQLGYCSVPIRVIGIDNELGIAEAIIEANRQRQKTFSVRMREAEVLRKIEALRAEQRMLAGTQGSPEPRVDHPTSGTVAQQVGLGSRATYDRARVVWDKAQGGDEIAVVLVKQIDAGETTIGAAYRELKVSAAEGAASQQVEAGSWQEDPDEPTLHWWERDPAMKRFWEALVSATMLAASEMMLDNLSDTECVALKTLIRGAIKELEKLL